MKRACLILLLALLWSPTPGHATNAVQAGNGQYRVVMDSWEPGTYASFMGFYAAFTGDAHPVTRLLGLQGTLNEPTMPCCDCYDQAFSALTFSAVRSFTSRTDYTLGKRAFGPYPMFDVPAPGYDCVNASDLTTPLVEQVMGGGVPVGVHGVWRIVNSTDDLEIDLLLRAHGQDFMDSSIEVSVTVSNLAASPVKVGVRDVWNLLMKLPRVSPADCGGGCFDTSIGLRDGRAPTEPYTERETAWMKPSFGAWEASFCRETRPSVRPPFYFIGGSVDGPPSLSPAPTAPDEIQQANYTYPTSATSPDESCFDWRVPVPGRLVNARRAMVTYWGLDEVDALEIAPGESRRVTQYLMAYETYPLTALDPPAVEVSCAGAVTRVPLHAEATALYPSASALQYRWTSDDRRVTFSDPDAQDTEAIVSGIGAFPVTFEAFIGPYFAKGETTVTVRDDAGPEMRLAVTPTSLWPPNHRMVDVHVDVQVDDCDPNPVLRLIAVRSSEPSLRVPGAGNFDPDIEGFDIGTGDLHGRLRAERSGRGSGRSYELVYEAVDWAGNTTQQVITVGVAHDQRLRRGR